MAITTAERILHFEAIDTRRRFKTAMIGIWLIMLGVIPLERIGLTFGDATTGSELPFATLGTMYASLVFFWLSGRVYVHMLRFSLFLLSTACLFFTVIIDPKPFSLLSILFIVACYVPFCFSFPVTEEEYHEVLKLFSNIMLIFAVLTLVQFVIYMAGGARTGWFEMIVPKNLLIQGYNNNARLSYEIDFQRPNGEVFLEPSFTSQFNAVAAIVELVFLRRYWRAGLFGIACLSTLSGTGTMLLAFYAVVIAIQRRQFALVIAGAVLFLILKSMPPDSPLGFFASRTNEVDQEGSSAYIRFVAPIAVLPWVLQDSFMHWIVGLGPGGTKALYNNDDLPGFNAYTVSKLMIEYGLVGTIPMMSFLTYSFLCEKFSLVFALCLFFMYNLLSGSLQQPHTVFLFFVLAIFFVPKRQEAI